MPDAPNEVQTTLRAASNLLEAGQYDQVDALLYTAQMAGVQRNDAFATMAVAAARQIYAAYRQCQADIEWYEQAGAEARQRERQLHQHVHALLNQLSGSATGGVIAQALPFPPLVEPAPLGLLTTLWLYLQKLRQHFRRFLTYQPEIPTLPLPPKSEAAPPLPVEPAPPSSPATPIPISGEGEPAPPSSPTAPMPISEPAPPSSAGLESDAQPSAPETPVVEPALPTAPTPEPIAAPPQAAYTLVIYCFGPLRVYQHDQLIEEWNGLKGQAVLKYLLTRRGAPVSKDVLMDLFWPDAEPEAARRNLHQAIYSLRQTLRRGDPDVQYIQFENNQYLLNPALSVWLDFEDFEQHTQNGRRLAAAGQIAAGMREYHLAEQLYHGDFLAEDVYEDWPRAQRERLRTLYMEMADQLSEYHLQQGEYASASALCRKLLTVDNCFEAAHRRLMRTYLAQGQRHLAIRQYQTCVQALAEELDVPPSEETVALYEQITANTSPPM
ncbi:MAG: BTAD domain-containing putative transcriptional regulator [Caldilineaceae bacterium]